MVAKIRSRRRLQTHRIHLSFRTRPIMCAIALCIAVFILCKRDNRESRRLRGERLLWATPRTGGFNNQLITIYQAIRCAQLQHRKLVLPLIYENVRADTSSKGFGPFPFEDYFNLSHLQRIVDVTTPTALDQTGLPCKQIYFATSKHFKAMARRIPRLLKQQYLTRYAVNLTYVDDKQAHKDKICVDDSFCEIPSEFGSYSRYNESGQGFNIRNSPVLENIRISLSPSEVVQGIADLVVKRIGGPFNAMHIRRGDFETKCDELPSVCKEFGNNSFVQSPKWIQEKAEHFGNSSLPVFISTTHPEECRELLAGRGFDMKFMTDVTLPDTFRWALERVDILSFSSQLVSSQAKEFVGNRFSSYTTEINNMRYLNNREDKIMFF